MRQAQSNILYSEMAEVEMVVAEVAGWKWWWSEMTTGDGDWK